MTALWRVSVRVPSVGAEELRAAFVALAPQGFEEREAAGGVELALYVDADRLAGFKRDIESGKASFEALARANSEDGSAPQGGELGWTSPGGLVPEFEEAMNALPLNGISDPVVSRFGVHLIQVLERRNVTLDAKQLREQARNVLREFNSYDEALGLPTEEAARSSQSTPCRPSRWSARSRRSSTP